MAAERKGLWIGDDRLMPTPVEFAVCNHELSSEACAVARTVSSKMKTGHDAMRFPA